MSDAKIQISVGSINFSGEGSQDWLEKQLDKLLKVAPDLLSLKKEDDSSGDTENSGNGGAVGTLAAFIIKKGVGANQNKRFLATAEWCHLKGKKRLAAKDVVKALSDNNQKRLGNPSDCLAQNVKQGHCERDGAEFFVTPEGRLLLK